MIDILEYIAEDNVATARKVIYEIKEKIEELAQNPAMGHLRKDLASEPLRFWQIYSYLIIYCHEQRPIEIVRILHGSRDILVILDDDD